MVPKRFSSAAAPLVCVAAIAGIPATHAQDAAGGLEEVIVTAQRRAESINDVGLSIQAFGAAALEALRVDDVKDLTTVVPSFTVSQSYQGVPTYTLRGIGFNTINLSATSTVGTYVDEVAYAYPIMNTGPLMDLERVEVLKGPQGTLYGRNTTAGLINFVTAKPTSEFQAGVTADVGNYETFNAGGYISGPLSERVQMRLAVRGEQSGEGWQESNSRDETLGEIKRYGVRGSLAMQPTDSTHIDLSATWWKNESDTVAGQGIGFTPATANSPFNAPGLVNYIAMNQPTDAREADWAPETTRASDIGTGLGLGGPLREDNPFMAFKLRLDQDLSDSMKLVSLTSYNEFERNALSDWSGAPYEILLQNTVGKIESFAEDLHLEGETQRMNWLVGAYYANDKILDSNRTLLGQNANVSLIRTVGLPLLATPFNCCGYTSTDLSQAFRTYVDEGHIETKTWSVFANADWRLTDALKLTTGVRYTEDEQEYRGCSHDFNGNMLPNVNVVNRALYFQAYGVFAAPIAEGQCNTFDPVAGSFGEIVSTLDEDNVSWRVALDWTPVEGTLLYTSVSRGAKAGTTPINPANLARQNAPVKQELLTAYEIGTKATLADQTVQANLSVFFYDYEDKQISTYFADPIYTALTRLDNVPESNAYGVDADLTWQPVDGFTIAGAVLWLQTEVEDYLGTNASGQPQNYDGAEFIYSPEWQGSLSFIYDRPVTSGLALQFTLNGRYQTESNTIFEDIDLYKIPSYGTVNASVGLRSVDDRWSLTLWSRNALDEYYWSAVASNANVVVRFPSPPRTYGVTGHPKGAMLSHRNLLSGRREGMRARMDWNEWLEGDVNLVALPVGHIGGIGWAIVGFLNGAKSIIQREFIPAQVLDAIEHQGVSRLFVVPTALQMLLLQPRVRQIDYSGLRHILYGASPIALDLLREATEVFGCGFCQQYGMTETCGTIVYLPPQDHDPAGNARMRAAGIPMPGVEIRIVDAETREPLPTGQVGEVETRSVANMVGYWNNSYATAHTVSADGWLRTGDAGYLDEDGYLYIHDRFKDMIVSGAENIYPAEVENAIYGHPAVQEVAVIGVPDEKWGEAVKAIIVPRPGATPNPQDIIDFAKTRIAAFKAPKSIEFAKELPRGPSGKILRRVLREPYWSGRERRVN